MVSTGGISGEKPGRAYSAYWRKNRSHHEATELALVLRALRKVAGHIGKNVKPIYWMGMTEHDNRSILLDPDEVKGKYPVTFKKMDKLVGRVVLEAFASIEWTDWVRQSVCERATAMPEGLKPYMEYLVAAPEDIYVDELVRPSIWSLYLSNYWRSGLYKDMRDPSLPPSPASLANIWQRNTFIGERPGPLHHYYDTPLKILTTYTDAIRDVSSLPIPGARREKRVEIYTEMWEYIHDAISGWEEFRPGPDSVLLKDEAAPRSGALQEETKKDASAGLESGLVRDVRSLLEDGDADLTQNIAVVVENPEAGFMETVYRRGVAKSNVLPDELHVRRLRKIFDMQDRLIRRDRKRGFKRGLIQGKIDTRRLYRAPFDERIFKKREPPHSDHSWHITIIADASASMGGRSGRFRPWSFAEKAFGSLVEAAKSSRNHLEIFAYNEEGGRCTLTELYRGDGELFTVLPAGRTPSGQAILACALMLKKRLRNSMIIHITDGATNCGLKMGDAVEYCQKNDIEMVTIGCGCNQQTQDFLGACLPRERLYFTDHMSSLADALESLFEQKMLDPI